MKKKILAAVLLFCTGWNAGTGNAVPPCFPDCAPTPASSQPDTGLFDLNNSTGIYLNSTPYSNTLTNQYLGPLQEIIHTMQNTSSNGSGGQVGIFNPSNYNLKEDAGKTELGSIVNTDFTSDNLAILLQQLMVQMQQTNKQLQKGQLEDRLQERNAQLSKLQKLAELMNLAAESKKTGSPDTPAAKLALLTALLQELAKMQNLKGGSDTPLPSQQILISMQQLMIQQQQMNQKPVGVTSLPGQGILQAQLSDKEANEAMSKALAEQLNSQLQNNQEFLQNTQQMINTITMLLKEMQQSQQQTMQSLNNRI